MLRESSNTAEETSKNEEQLSDWGMDDFRYAQKLVQSKDVVDRRLIDLYMIKKAHEKGVYYGFNDQKVLSKEADKRLMTKNF